MKNLISPVPCRNVLGVVTQIQNAVVPVVVAVVPAVVALVSAVVAMPSVVEAWVVITVEKVNKTNDFFWLS